MNIVVCDDVDGAFEQSGELSRLSPNSLKVYDTVAETRAALVERLRGNQIAVAVRDRTVFDRDSLAALLELRLVAVTAGPHRSDIQAATEMGVAVAMTPAGSFASIAEYVFGLTGSVYCSCRVGSASGLVGASRGIGTGRKDPEHFGSRKDWERGR